MVLMEKTELMERTDAVLLTSSITISPLLWLAVLLQKQKGGQRLFRMLQKRNDISGRMKKYNTMMIHRHLQQILLFLVCTLQMEKMDAVLKALQNTIWCQIARRM